MLCKRCLNRNRFYFKKCYIHDNCFICVKCEQFNQVHTSNYISKKLEFIPCVANYNIPYLLSMNQLSASQKIIKALAFKNIFINAVCGCGKTELLFPIIKHYLNTNKAIVIIIPRQVLLIELAKRISLAFNIDVGLIYQKSKCTKAVLFMMTPQQLLNYKNQVDLLIIDEVDAFPVHNNQVLENAFTQCLNKNGKIIKMSATPLAISKSYYTITLYNRYHNYLLPIPIIIKDFKGIDFSKNWILFFSSIHSLNEFSKSFAYKHLIIHSKIDDFDKTIEKFPDTNIILSTTILERGVTFKDVNVLVYNASHPTFSLNVLIQIAGRVNRHHDIQTNKVYYLDNTMSLAMIKSIKHLKEMNRRAKMSDLLQAV